MDPFLDFTMMSEQELLKRAQDYTNRIMKTEPSSPIFGQLLDLKDACQAEYRERMMLRMYKEDLEKGDQAINIGDINSQVSYPDYRDSTDKIIHDLAMWYSKKEK